MHDDFRCMMGDMTLKDIKRTRIKWQIHKSYHHFQFISLYIYIYIFSAVIESGNFSITEYDSWRKWRWNDDDVSFDEISVTERNSGRKREVNNSNFSVILLVTTVSSLLTSRKVGPPLVTVARRRSWTNLAHGIERVLSDDSRTEIPLETRTRFSKIREVIINRSLSRASPRSLFQLFKPVSNADPPLIRFDSRQELDRNSDVPRPPIDERARVFLPPSNILSHFWIRAGLSKFLPSFLRSRPTNELETRGRCEGIHRFSIECTRLVNSFVANFSKIYEKSDSEIEKFSSLTKGKALLEFLRCDWQTILELGKLIQLIRRIRKVEVASILLYWRAAMIARPHDEITFIPGVSHASGRHGAHCECVIEVTSSQYENSLITFDRFPFEFFPFSKRSFE